MRKTEDKAVSTVIGVILMVAIAVVLAAVIGSYFLSLGGEVSETPQAGVAFGEDGGDSLTVTVVDGGNLDELIVQADSAATVSGDGLGESEVVKYTDRISRGYDNDDIDDDRVVLQDPRAGDKITITECGGQTEPPVVEERVTVIGVVNGEEAVIRNYEVSDPVDGEVDHGDC